MKEKEMKKRWLLEILCMLSIIMILSSARTVHAEQSIKSGSYTYTVTQKYSPRYQSLIYSQKKGSAKKKLLTVSGSADLKFVYKGYLYYEKDRLDDPECIDFWALNLKTNKAKRICANKTVVARSGSYVVLMPNTGAVMPLKCIVYNLNTKKSKTLTNNCLGAAISGKKIYYAETSSNKVTNNYKIRIYSCSLSGSGKKAISKSFTGNYCYNITSKYVQYYKNGKRYKLKF